MYMMRCLPPHSSETGSTAGGVIVVDGSSSQEQTEPQPLSVTSLLHVPVHYPPCLLVERFGQPRSSLEYVFSLTNIAITQQQYITSLQC